LYASAAKRSPIIQILFIVISTCRRRDWSCWRCYRCGNIGRILAWGSNHFATIFVDSYICPAGISNFISTCVIKIVESNSLSSFIAEKTSIRIEISCGAIRILLIPQKICFCLCLILLFTIEIFLFFGKWNFRSHLSVI
jgi:hypothetical protein